MFANELRVGGIGLIPSFRVGDINLAHHDMSPVHPDVLENILNPGQGYFHLGADVLLGYLMGKGIYGTLI